MFFSSSPLRCLLILLGDTEAWGKEGSVLSHHLAPVIHWDAPGPLWSLGVSSRKQLLQWPQPRPAGSPCPGVQDHILLRSVLRVSV